MHDVAVVEPLGGGVRTVVEPVHQCQTGACHGVRIHAQRRVVGGEQHHAHAAPRAEELEEGGTAGVHVGTSPSRSSTRSPWAAKTVAAEDRAGEVKMPLGTQHPYPNPYPYCLGRVWVTHLFVDMGRVI